MLESRSCACGARLSCPLSTDHKSRGAQPHACPRVPSVSAPYPGRATPRARARALLQLRRPPQAARPGRHRRALHPTWGGRSGTDRGRRGPRLVPLLGAGDRAALAPVRRAPNRRARRVPPPPSSCLSLEGTAPIPPTLPVDPALPARTLFPNTPPAPSPSPASPPRPSAATSR